MGRKWRKSRLSLTTGFILSAVLASQASAQHPAVKLIDVNGTTEKQILDQNLANNETITVQGFDGNVTLVKGTPISFEKSCAQCHENIITDIRASHHGAVGLHDMGWMDNMETHGDDTGAKDFVTNQVLKMRYFRTKSHYGGW
ncbi:hypothetical protein [Thermovibrio ammonificans]|jgi:hypothetical protein|uniref:Cytochrome c domain-containing protein n=1 Tax=Thermovibrio ammonificans (strain DSM 15698 / JCM 12110 / HB-1) TaxID=648996 RepID=E8T5I5_THEA1|nr:hypothetical protein [Thermovibrio ammonificans]ADU97639.1 hypothetical protein Theam_1683 [Thermovibrio ammonificans HB-1]